MQHVLPWYVMDLLSSSSIKSKRPAQACKQSLPDVADHFYLTMTSIGASLGGKAIECPAAALLGIGREYLGKGQFTRAVKWLERANELIENENQHSSSAYANELRFSILYHLGVFERKTRR